MFRNSMLLLGAIGLLAMLIVGWLDLATPERDSAVDPPVRATVDPPPQPIAGEPVVRSEVGLASEPPATADAKASTKPPRRLAVLSGFDTMDSAVPDPVEDGDCALELRCVDAATLEPLKSRVMLWRLGAPATEHWTEGDQAVTDEVVPPNSARIEGLPEGRYRAVVFAGRDDGDDPAEFAVRGEFTSITLAVMRPGEELAFVRLFTEVGVPIDGALRQTRGPSATLQQVHERPWTRSRSSRIERGESRGGISETRYVFSGMSSWRAFAAGPSGFEIGPYRLASIDVDSKDFVTFMNLEHGCCDVEVLSRDRGEARHYVGVLISSAAVMSRIVMPDGTDPATLGRDIEVRSKATSRIDLHAADSWRDVPVTVAIDDSRFEYLKVTFTLREGIPEIRLVAR